jgi:hypothetical protein
MWHELCPILRMSFLSGSDRQQTHLLPPALEDYIGADNPVRFLDASVAKLDLLQSGFFPPRKRARFRPSGLSSGGSAEALSSRIFEPGAVLASAGSRMPSQHGSDLADVRVETGSQDDRRLSIRSLLLAKLILFADAI